MFRIPKSLYLAPTRWNLLVSSSLRPISSPVTNISAQSVTFLRQKKNITDIRSWFGLINQVSYCDSLRIDMAPFREHLKPLSTFYCDDQLQQVFEQSKAATLDKIRIFDSKRVTCLATDWSKKGIGFWLLQKYCTCEVITPVCCSTGWQIVFAGSRFTHPAESRYAPIEGKVYGLESARHFVLGCNNLVVATDHKPLLGVLNNRHLGDIKNERLLSLKEKTLPYRFSIIHIPGQKQKAPDANSRKPTGDAKKLPLDSDFEESDSIACIEPRLRLPEATMTWEPDKSADLEEKLAVLRPPTSATFALLHGRRSENTPYAMKIYKISKKRSKTVPRALPYNWNLPRVYENSSNSRMDSAQWME